MLFKIITFRYFDFFCSGRRKGEFEAPGRGGSAFIENPRGGGLPGREGPRGRESVCGELGNFGGGGPNIFFSGPKCPSSYYFRNIQGITATAFRGLLN